LSLYTVQNIVKAGLTPTFAAVTSSDTFPCPSDLRTYLEVKNAGGSPINVTIPAVQTTINTVVAGDITVADMVVSIPATTGNKKIGPIPPAYISAGIVTANFSGITSVTAGAFHLNGS